MDRAGGVIGVLAAAIDIPEDLQVSETAAYVAEQVIAAVVAVGLLCLAAIAVGSWTRNKSAADRRTGLWMGKDGRISTSKALALAWTAVVVYCLLSLIFIVAAHHTGPVGDYLGEALRPLQGNYLVLLGAPFGAFLAAKGIVANRVRAGQIQKTTGEGARPADLVADDEGNVDLVDFQYTVFNLAAMVFVLTQFAPHPGLGLPGIPASLAILIGASAGTYTANKGLVTNPLVLNEVSPQVARVGERVTVHGQNLYLPNAKDNDKPNRGVTVTIGGMPAAIVPNHVTSSHVDVTVPDPPPGTEWGSELDVQLTSNSHRSAVCRRKLKVVQDTPRLRTLTPASGPPGTTVTVHGRYLQPPTDSGLEPAVRARLTDKTTTVDADGLRATDHSLQFVVPAELAPPADASPPESNSRQIKVSVVRTTGVSGPLPFTVTAAPSGQPAEPTPGNAGSDTPPPGATTDNADHPDDSPSDEIVDPSADDHSTA